MKNVGIITMHKVLNYGSALQAYALQEIVKRLGYNAQIIDYIYPNDYHKRLRGKSSLLMRFILGFIQLLYGFPQNKRIQMFEKFYHTFFNLSPLQYNNQESLKTNPPIYDIYLTGSDQVWNSYYIGFDTSFLLSFVKNVPKISYSSSFVSDTIKEEYKDLYKKYLSQYQSFGVREQNGKKIIKDLLMRDANVVLDPTILLSPKDYETLVTQSTFKYTEPYILAYVLGYSFNPYPYIESVIDYVQSKLGIKTYLLCVSNTKMLFKNNSKRLQEVGPCEFVSLFKNASFVITTSFHGTAFSIIYQKPFFALVDDNKDDRIKNLLSILDLQSRILYNNTLISADVSYQYTANNLEKFEDLKRQSLDYLKNALSDAQ